ncbi:MAG TPA: penicillin-binding protein activator [Methylotenera sp.]|nr:penicillin-binding protein activator [Methylotenera sp.]
MYRQFNLLQHALIRFLLILISTLCINTTSWAGNTISAETVFLQGQKHLEQANTALAEVSLARIPTTSPYAKLLAGNIAAKNEDMDKAFLLLLPLQSSNTLSKPAAASLHASLSSAYEKQGAYYNVLDQLIRREAYLEDASAINNNHENIWHLLSGLSLENLVEIRGESADTTTQGWIDLGLVAKNQDVASGINTWLSSYPDHTASELAKALAAKSFVSENKNQTPVSLPAGGIALILPFDNSVYSAKAEAFKLGLQAALTKNTLSNEVKSYASLGDKESFADLNAFAKDEGAAYFIGPMLNEELVEARPNVKAFSLLDSATPASKSFIHAGFSLQDEAQAITQFAVSNAIQHILIIASDSEVAKQQVASFEAIWHAALGYEAKIILLPLDTKSGNGNLLDLKTSIATYPHEMVLLALSASEALLVKPYLNISTPTLAFSSVNNLGNDVDSGTLNAVRFVDIPFLTDSDNPEFSAYRSASTTLNSNELLRWFALGVDSLQLLIANTRTPETELVINGLTGKLTLDKTNQLKRQLSIARFTYDGVVAEK